MNLITVFLCVYVILHIIVDCLDLYIWFLNRKIRQLRKEGAQAFIEHCKKISSIDPRLILEINIPGWHMTWPIKEAIKFGWTVERIRGDQTNAK